MIQCSRAARFFEKITRHLFLESLEYVWAALKRIWTRVAVFCGGESVVEFFSNKMLYKKFYKTLSPQQKTATLVQILFRAAHTYSKDSKKRCLVNWKKSGRPRCTNREFKVSFKRIRTCQHRLAHNWTIWLINPGKTRKGDTFLYMSWFHGNNKKKLM